MSGILEWVQETWTMEKAKRARKAETPKRPSLHLRPSAPALYSTPLFKHNYSRNLGGKGGSTTGKFPGTIMTVEVPCASILPLSPVTCASA